jgi:hypothetical protein
MENNNILIISYYYPPMNSIGGQRAYFLNKYFVANDIKTFIVCAGIKNEVKDNIYYFEDKNLNNTSKIEKVNSRLSRVISKYSGYNKDWFNNVETNILDIVDKHDIKIVITSFPPIETFLLGKYIKEERDIKLILDYRDGMTFEPLERNLEFLLLKNKLLKVEKDLIVNSDAVVTVSSPITTYLEKRYKEFELPFRTIYNGYYSEETINVEPKIFDKNFINIVYTGKLSKSSKGQNVDLLLEALRKLPKSEYLKYKIHFFGDYSRGEIKEFKEFNIININGKVSKEESISAQLGADLLLFSTTTNRTSVVTGKLFEYLRTGKFILSLSSGCEADKIIIDTNSGGVFYKNDLNRLCDFLIKQEFKINQKNIDKYNYKYISNKYISLLNSL